MGGPGPEFSIFPGARNGCRMSARPICSQKMRVLMLFVGLAAAVALASSQNTPASYCSSPIHPTSPKNNAYDLSWWITQYAITHSRNFGPRRRRTVRLTGHFFVLPANRGPFTTMDRTNTYTFTFAVCNTLPQPCLDNADPGETSVCAAANSGYACQSWPNPSSPQTPYSSCCASTAVPPTFTEYCTINN